MATTPQATADPHSNRKPQGLYALLNPPMQYSTLQLRAADAMRHRWPLTPNAPAGFYVDKDGKLVAHGLEVSKGGDAEESDAATDYTDLFDTSEGPPSDTSDSELASDGGGSDASKSQGSDLGPAPSHVSADNSGNEGDRPDLDPEPKFYDGLYSHADIEKVIHDADKGSISCIYTISVETNDKSQVYSKGHRDVGFQLLIDTGSNTTWVRGANVAEIGEYGSMTVPVNETTPPKADATDGSIPVPSGQADPGTSTLQAPGGTVRPQGAATGALSSNVTAPQSQVAVDPKAPAEGSAPAATTPAPAKPTEVIKGYHIHRIPGDQLQGKSRLVDYYNPCDSSYQRRKSYLFAHEKLAHGTVKYGLTEPYRVVLLSHDRSKTWTVSESFAWGGQPTKAWPHPLKVHDFKMGVAFAGAKSDVLNKRFDGILGLGTLRYQNAFVHRSKSSYRTVGDYDDILSFIAALSPSLPQQTGDIANKGIEIVVYLILRPSPRTLSVEVPSCMAWQAWPFGFTPQWSAPLFVRDPSSGKWRLWLKGIRIWHGPEWNQSPLHKTQTTPPTAYVPIPAGWAFELDTGTSLSYFPQQIWDPLVRSLPVDTKHASSIDAGPGSYRLRDKGKGTKHRWLQGYIEFVFESKTKSKTESVSVWTRVQPFLFDRDGNGGVFSVPLGDETSGNALPGILGLNFLQGTYTALHYPRHGRGPPYVRMAMQDRPAVDDPSHQLPPEA